MVYCILLSYFKKQALITFSFFFFAKLFYFFMANICEYESKRQNCAIEYNTSQKQCKTRSTLKLPGDVRRCFMYFVYCILLVRASK
jgi:hypothetical protein